MAEGHIDVVDAETQPILMELGLYGLLSNTHVETELRHDGKSHPAKPQKDSLTWSELEPDQFVRELMREAFISRRTLLAWKHSGLIDEARQVFLGDGAIYDRRQLACAINSLLEIDGESPPAKPAGGLALNDEHGLSLIGSRQISLGVADEVDTGYELHVPDESFVELAMRSNLEPPWPEDGFQFMATMARHAILVMPSWFPSYRGPGRFRVTYVVMAGGLLHKHLDFKLRELSDYG